MHAERWIITFALVVGAGGCGSGTDQIDSGAPDMRYVDISCKDSNDCPAAFPVCVYAVDEGCNAKGSCGLVLKDTGVTLALCGCDGQLVPTTTQLYAGGGGYAFGPVSSAETYPVCDRDGGTSPGPTDAGVATPAIFSFVPASPPAGQIVTIVGAGFNPYPDANMVTIGGMTTPALGTSTATNVLVVVPPGIDALAQPVQVQLTTPGGTATANLTVPPATGARLATITGFAGPHVKQYGAVALVTTGAGGTDVDVLGTSFGTDESQVKLVLGNDSGAPTFSPVPGSLTDTKLTVHLVASTLGSFVDSLPHIVVGATQGLPSSLTLYVSQ